MKSVASDARRAERPRQRFPFQHEQTSEPAGPPPLVEAPLTFDLSDKG